MNYEKIYWELIRKGIKRKMKLTSKKKIKKAACEIHHAIPKSLGGRDVDWNYIPLTVKEHALAHLLLLRWTGKDDCGTVITNSGGIRRYCKTRIIGYAVQTPGYIWNGEGLFSKTEEKILNYVSNYIKFQQDVTRVDIIKRFSTSLLNNILAQRIAA